MRAKHLYFRLLFLFLLITIFACGNRTNKSNKYFGKIPSVFAKYEKNRASLKNQKELTSSVGKTLELKSKLKELKKEKLDHYQKAYNQLDFPIKMHVSGNFDYPNHTIKDIYISDISAYGRVEITAISVARKDSVCPFAFVQFAGPDGKILNDRDYVILTLLSSIHGETTKEEVKAGKEITLRGYYNHVSRLAEAEELIMISDREYFKND